MNNYYLYKHSFHNALITNDSLIKYAWMTSQSNVPGLLDINSQIYEAMEDNKNAFKYHKLYIQVQDSIKSSNLKKQLSELQVKYEVDQLNHENYRLETKNRRILVITLFMVLVLVMSICFYLYYDLKKDRWKKVLGELNQKAGESEKMKTAFINSMCHEIRTPLNAIVGFSGIITANAEILTSLIDHLLVVANLDSSDAPLLCEQTR